MSSISHEIASRVLLIVRDSTHSGPSFSHVIPELLCLVECKRKARIGSINRIALCLRRRRNILTSVKQSLGAGFMQVSSRQKWEKNRFSNGTIKKNLKNKFIYGWSCIKRLPCMHQIRIALIFNNCLLQFKASPRRCDG